MLLFSFIIFSIFVILMGASLAVDRTDIAFVDFVGTILSMVEILILIV